MTRKSVRPSVFDRYPQFLTLKGLVPDEVVEREIGSKAAEFERTLARARRVIPHVRLCDVFPPEIERGAARSVSSSAGCVPGASWRSARTTG